MPQRPLCFVLMPFGQKPDPSGRPDIDFDALYDGAIRPAIDDAGLEPIRADAERTGGVIHVAMFERLLLCEFAVADLTTANPNVFYELGVRHATRPCTTLPIFARNQPIPFDLHSVRALPYDLGAGNAVTNEVLSALRASLCSRLTTLREEALTNADAKDSPLFQLVSGMSAPNIDRLRTDTFRERARYSTASRRRLNEARRAGDKDELCAIEEELAEMDGAEVGVVLDLFLSYRAVAAYEAMVALHGRMPDSLKRHVMVREQLGFALNRLGRRSEAADVLEQTVEEYGPSSETLGVLGRVYKDRWTDAVAQGDTRRAAGELNCAISTYVRGFEADWRDAYPGINALTLLDIRGTQADRELEATLLPVVRFAVQQRLTQAAPDYWDHATLLELAVLGRDAAAAAAHLGDALAAVREPWEPQTTARNLGMIRDARQARSEDVTWLSNLITTLKR